MRRTATLLFALTMIVAACASDSDDAEVESSPTIQSAVATQPPSTPAPEPIKPAATEPPTTAPATTGPIATQPPTTEPAQTAPPTTEAPTTTEPPTTEPAQTAPPIESVGLGEYDVGVQTITITDTTRDRPLTVDVWFPLAAGTTGEPHRHSFVTGDYYESPDAITADASAISPEAPFPLVLWSHGSGGTRYQSSFYTEAIASHGYVVAAPDHTGNTAVDRFAGGESNREEIALNRVQDIGVVLDEMLNPESLETVGFVGSINPDQIAVSGHSFGGFTTYAMVSGYDNALGSVEGDDRVDAIIPLAPAVGDGGPDGLLSDERLAMVDVPALVMVGTNDQTTPIDPNVTRAWDLTASDPSYRLELVDAQHQSFTDICDYAEFIPALENPTPIVVELIEELAVEGCSLDDMDIERAKELTNTFAITFLDSVFADDEMITPDAFAIPDDVNYLVK